MFKIYYLIGFISLFTVIKSSYANEIPYTINSADQIFTYTPSNSNLLTNDYFNVNLLDQNKPIRFLSIHYANLEVSVDYNNYIFEDSKLILKDLNLPLVFIQDGRACIDYPEECYVPVISTIYDNKIIEFAIIVPMSKFNYDKSVADEEVLNFLQSEAQFMNICTNKVCIKNTIESSPSSSLSSSQSSSSSSEVAIEPTPVTPQPWYVRFWLWLLSWW